MPRQEELVERGDTAFPKYEENLQALQDAAEAQPEEQWLGRAYSAWLYSFLPVLAEKNEAYPDFMRSQAWALKDVNAVLGSWAELKHDTVLYSKMPEGTRRWRAAHLGPGAQLRRTEPAGLLPHGLYRPGHR